MDRPSPMPLNSRPLNRPRVSDEIVQRLEQAIMEGDYRVGHNLPSERELMAAFQVGRPAVREALYTLAQRGVIEVRSGTRARVTEPNAVGAVGNFSALVRHVLGTSDGVAHFQQIRALFEVGLVRMAATDGSEHDLQALQQALGANEKAIGNRKKFNQTDVDFHFQLAQRTGNPVILAIHEAMANWLAEQREVALDAGGMSRAYREHARICEAVVRRDPDAAARAMQDHLDLVAHNYHRRMQARRTLSTRTS